MAKGGFQRRRIKQKKQQEKQARRRARRRRILLTWTTVLALVGLIAALALAFRGDGDNPSLAGSPTPTPSDAQNCTKPQDAKKGQKTFQAAPCNSIDTAKTYTATMKTSMGTITVDLYDEKAPKTVNNFVFLSRLGYFDGSIFHRVIPDFGKPGTSMIQGGDAVNRDGTGGPGYQFEDENPEPFAQPGMLAMANSGPGTNGSQFFFLSGPVDHLNAPGSCPGPQGCHTVFGKISSGMDVIDRIAKVERGANDAPARDVVVEKVTITEK